MHEILDKTGYFVKYIITPDSKFGEFGDRASEKKATRFEGRKTTKKGFDRSVIVRSNWGWAFVINKTLYGGWGRPKMLLERQQIDVKRPSDSSCEVARMIAKIGTSKFGPGTGFRL